MEWKLDLRERFHPLQHRHLKNRKSNPMSQENFALDFDALIVALAWDYE